MTDNEIIKYLYKKGYRVENNKLYSFTGNELKLRPDRNGYYRKTIRIRGFNNGYPLAIHRLVAYQKYGDRLFETGIEVRHIDGNKLNNHEYNISIGTHSKKTMEQF